MIYYSSSALYRRSHSESRSVDKGGVFSSKSFIVVLFQIDDFSVEFIFISQAHVHPLWTDSFV
jgi:hypothetical protein